jgi:hypothetical protein
VSDRSGDDPRLAALHAPFLSVRGRRVAIAVAVAQALVLGALATVPYGVSSDLSAVDRVGFCLVALAVGWVLARLAMVRAVPTSTGLQVRNIINTQDLEWAQIVDVRFPDGEPWVSLNLSDGDTLAVMAIQRADGDHGRAEAVRLSTLVELHSRTERND